MSEYDSWRGRRDPREAPGPDQAAPARSGPTPQELLRHRIIQRRRAARAASQNAEQAAAAAAPSQGQPLPGGVKSQMESSFRSDFSDVRVHTGSEAARSTEAVGAEAYTSGRDVFFSPGAYDPGSQKGQELLAHELTHVVQQRGGAAGAVQQKSAVSQPGDAAEVEADQVAANVMAGQPVAVSAAPSAAVHRRLGGAVHAPAPQAEEEAEEAEAQPEAQAEPEAEAQPEAAEAEPAEAEEPANADPAVAAVEAEAQQLAPEVAAELGPGVQNQAVAHAFQEMMAPEAEAEAEPLPQPEPAPAAPSRFQRMKAAVGGALSSAATSIKKAFTFSKAEKQMYGNQVKDTAKLGVSAGKVAVPVGKVGGDAVQASATLASHAATAAGSGGAAANATQVASTAGQVSSVAGHAALPAAAITAAVDARSAYSSGKKAARLNSIANQARDRGDQEMRGAANYARDQKVKKTVRRTLTAAGAVLSFAGGIALLVSNPVGWILALAGGLIGMGVMAHKIYRKFFKAKKGVLRHEFSLKLQQGCVANNPSAIAAVKALGLDPRVVVDGPAGLSLIERKLKAT